LIQECNKNNPDAAYMQVSTSLDANTGGKAINGIQLANSN
jgi:hypothetical protein